jgi:hypothetical protein
MGVGIYYFYHRFELKAFEGHHIRMPNEQFPAVSWQEQVIFIYYITHIVFTTGRPLCQFFTPR